MARTSNSVRRSQSAAYKRTPYQKTAYVNGTAVRHAEVGEGLERHLDQVSGRVPRRELEKQKQEFQTKYQNNAYLSQERAQQEYNRIAKLEQDLQNLSNKLQSELMSENEKNSLQLRDSINAFLKEYNKTKGYSMIISNTGFDNLLYADSVYNITREILDGLNARYSSPVKK